MRERPRRRATSARRSAVRRELACAAALPLLLGEAEAARAADYEVEARTEAQAYEVASPWGATLDRRRLTQTLGLAAHNLQGAYRPGEADYSVVVLVRLDADLGVNDQLSGAQAGGETTYATAVPGARYVPGLRPAPLDVVYGYVEGQNLAHGWLGFRLGRQYVTDMLGWWSFDGALVRVTTPFFVRAEVYGGFEQRGELPLSTSRYEAQGVWRGSHSDFGTNGDAPRLADYPSFQYAEPAPAFGVALESAGVSFLHGRLDYRHVYNQGTTITQQFPDPSGGYRAASGVRTSTEKIGYAADGTLGPYGDVRGGFAYDLYANTFSSVFGGLEGHLGRAVTLGADVDYFLPTFDGDSIWNWFTHDAVLTMTGRAAVRLTRELDVAATAGARQWRADGDPATFAAAECRAAASEGRTTGPDCLGTTFDPSTGAVRDVVRDAANRTASATTDGLANVAGRYRWPSGDVSLRGMVQAGERGRRVGGDLSGEKRLSGGRYSLGARTSLYDWDDPLRPDRSATSFGYVLGVGYRPMSSADLRIEWEHDMNRLVGQRFRVVALLNVWAGR
jgi:hypothetical protein